MERQKNLRKDWIVGQDDIGRAILEWKVPGPAARGPDVDPCARTHDFLNRLEAAGLSLEDEPSRKRPAKGINPYDTGRLFVRQIRD
jgi:hypothetical protein